MTAADWMDPWDRPIRPRVVRVLRYDRQKYWRMRDGRLIDISVMVDSHLTNAILMIQELAKRTERNFTKDVRYLALVAEAEHRSDLAEFRTRGHNV